MRRRRDMPVARIALRDADLSARFERRMRQASAAIMAIFLVIFSFQVLLSPAMAHLPHAITMFLGALAAMAARDAVNRIFYAGTALMFSFMLYLNATLHLQPVDSGLLDPTGAALIAMASQSGVTLVALIDRAVPLAALPADTAAARVGRLHDMAMPLFAVVLGGLLLDLSGALPAILSESLRFFVPLPLAMRFLARQPSLRDPWLLALTGLQVLIAVRTNARSDLLTVGLVLAFLYLIHAERLFSLLRLALVWVALRLVDVFSAVVIAVRPLREDAALMLREFRERFFATETLVSVVNPFHAHSAHRAFDLRQTDTIYFSTGFFHGETASLFDRLTLLPQMDIVTGRLAAPVGMDVGRWLQATVMSALPNFGQDKMNMLGDELVWDLALRSRESIGRPMITAQAEAWSMGGYLAVFLTACLAFGAWAVNWRLLSRQVPLRSAAVTMGAMFMVYALFSTTLTSQTMSLWRMPLQTMAGLAVAMALARLMRARRPTLGPQGV